MKKVYDVEVDCANCAAKMEEAIKKIEGVNDAVVSFMAQTLTIDADEERLDKIIKQVKKCIAKVDSDCTLIM